MCGVVYLGSRGAVSRESREPHSGSDGVETRLADARDASLREWRPAVVRLCPAAPGCLQARPVAALEGSDPPPNPSWHTFLGSKKKPRRTWE